MRRKSNILFIIWLLIIFLISTGLGYYLEDFFVSKVIENIKESSCVVRVIDSNKRVSYLTGTSLENE